MGGTDALHNLLFTMAEGRDDVTAFFEDNPTPQVLTESADLVKAFVEDQVEKGLKVAVVTVRICFFFVTLSDILCSQGERLFR